MKDIDLINIEVSQVTEILTKATRLSVSTKKRSRKNKPKLQVWNSSIAKALTENRKAHRQWRIHGSPLSLNDQYFLERKQTKMTLRI